MRSEDLPAVLDLTTESLGFTPFPNVNYTKAL